MPAWRALIGSHARSHVLMGVGVKKMPWVSPACEPKADFKVVITVSRQWVQLSLSACSQITVSHWRWGWCQVRGRCIHKGNHGVGKNQKMPDQERNSWHWKLYSVFIFTGYHWCKNKTPGTWGIGLHSMLWVLLISQLDMSAALGVRP